MDCEITRRFLKNTLGLLVVTASLMLAPYAFPRQEEGAKALNLTLAQCISMTLEGNLDIAVSKYTPEISAEGIAQAREKYLPKLYMNYSNQNLNYLGNWGIEGTNFQSESQRIVFSLDQKVFTGADIQFRYTNQTSESTRNYTAVNPQYWNELSLDITQPLLKNFGRGITNYEIDKAKIQTDVSMADLDETTLTKIYDVEEAYWNLVYSLENLKVRQLSLEQSQVQLKRTREAARMGNKSSIDVLGAETEVANWEDQVLSARAQVETYQDRLKKILNLPTEGGESSAEMALIPTDDPVISKPDMDFKEALDIGLARSPGVARLRKQLEGNRLDIKYYRNQLLPQLDVNFSIWYPGQSGIRNIYLNNNPLTGVIIDRIEGSRWDALKDILKRTYQNWSLSMTLNLPLENLFSRSRLSQARLEEEKNEAEWERLEKNLYYDLQEVFKSLKNNERRLSSTARYREMVEKKLEAEQQRYRLGLVGSEWLFRYQQDLAQAKASEIKAITDYKVTVARLEQILGISLEKYQ
jgi:outer membrane protein TolC